MAIYHGFHMQLHCLNPPLALLWKGNSMLYILRSNDSKIELLSQFKSNSNFSTGVKSHAQKSIRYTLVLVKRQAL